MRRPTLTWRPCRGSWKWLELSPPPATETPARSTTRFWTKPTGRILSTFADTSALYAVLDRDDEFHGRAATGWRDVVERRAPLLTHSYILVEAVALIQRRLGPSAVRALKQDIFPLLDVVWVEERLHEAAMTALLAAGRGDVSLVDSVSFELMRQRGVLQAFAFDDHFVAQGFTLYP